MITCEQFWDKTFTALVGSPTAFEDMAASERFALLRHLSQCSQCEEKWKDLVSVATEGMSEEEIQESAEYGKKLAEKDREEAKRQIELN